jgi:23S rRNA pseudouridine1911/1915/1917 synthase
MNTWSIPASLQGARVDRAACTLTGLSMAAVRRLCVEGRVLLDGRTCSKGDTVRVGQTLAAQVEWLVAPTSSIAVLYVDRRVVVVDKPAGMPCHPLVPGEGGTALDAVAALYPDVATASPDPRQGRSRSRVTTSLGMKCARRLRARTSTRATSPWCMGVWSARSTSSRQLHTTRATRVA